MKHLLLVWALSAAATAFSNDWKTAATQSGLTAADIQTLEANRLLISNESYKQVFSAYIDQAENPVFITSDSLLNGFHVLFEETVFHLENTNAGKLEKFLKKLITNPDSGNPDFKGDEKVLTAARTRVKLTLGVAIRLLDPSFRLGQPDLDSIIALEVARIEAAEEIISPPPQWLGPPSDDFPGIEYNRYKPRGFYTRSENLSRYFRALAWLHSIPFRVNNDVELLGMILLKEGDERCYDEEPIGITDLYWLFGLPDNPDFFTGAVTSSDINYEDDGLNKERSEVLKRNDWGLINDEQPNYRIISAARTPSALLFQRTMELTAADRDLPTGLEIAAALGSTKAVALLNEQGYNGLIPALHEMNHLFPQASYIKLYNGPRMFIELPDLYYRALALLLDAPPSDAPDFMSTPAWQLKSINTVLGSWTQMRHTTALQAKNSAYWLSKVEMPAGFVEPDPEFFEQMASLALAVRSKLSKQTLITDYTAVAEDIRSCIAFTKPFKTEEEIQYAFLLIPPERQDALLLGEDLPSYDPEDLQWLSKLADDIEAGKIEKHPRIKKLLDEPRASLHQRWEQLEQISQKLENIAHKQLRNIPLSEIDTFFVKSYGAELARVMLYDGNSYLIPRDDAPRIVDVYSNIDKGKHLQVGISRARKMYVLYPWQGATILCEGAVLPYYEFAHPTRLNDAEWKQMLDSKTRPSLPDWLEPIVSGGNLSTPKLK
ncbi:DUF3160 domain-containing protein [Pontiellaceae bacterium B1224]|nr:DUF3160 domain-containing protein [Pontiellaceae bacterium B1224]